MAKLTVLTMVQKILSSMDSDDVNSISDTEEALQVVDIIEDTYNDMIVDIDPPSISSVDQLENVSDLDRPTTLKIPERFSEIGKIKYEITKDGDADRSFRDLHYCDPQEFIDKLLYRNSSNPNVQEVTAPSGTPLFIFNDESPRYWTSFDDEYVVADSYDALESSTLVGSKSVVLCKILPSFTKSDNFIPDLPEKYFPLFLAEAKRACHQYLLKQDSATDAKRTLKGNSAIKAHKRKAHDKKKKIRFGRK